MWRHEYKYIISDAQLELLKFRIKELMQIDSNTNGESTYSIRSLYFDDYNNSCYYENENGVDPRKKYRIRIYNNDDSIIRLELKQKACGMCYKSSCKISKTEFENIITGESILTDPHRPLLNMFGVEVKIKGLHPVVIVDYVREPYIYTLGNVRVTFDTKVSSSSDYLSFFNRNICLKPIMPVGMQLMEVKFDEFIPDYIYRALQLDDLIQTAFSKYYLCRKLNIQ